MKERQGAVGYKLESVRANRALRFVNMNFSGLFWITKQEGFAYFCTPLFLPTYNFESRL
jgi:hypothetical protein